MSSHTPLLLGEYNSNRINDKYSLLGRKALAFAAKGIPVFPVYWLEDGVCGCYKGVECHAPGKHPVYDKRLGLIHGHKEATANPNRIRRWWEIYPDANVAYPTGSPSGIVSLDDDVYKQGAWTPDDIERELGPLPETTVVGTGSGGMQYLYWLPEGETFKTIPEGELGPGVCVKAEGGYIIAPPSVTIGPYTVLERKPIADVPAWLLEAMRERGRRRPSEGAKGKTRKLGTTARVDPNEPPIEYGSRNEDLTSIAGTLHDGTRSLDELTKDLMTINEARSIAENGTPKPLPEGEVAKIARSIHKREPCKPSVRVTPETIATLDIIEEEMWERPERWRGKAGLSKWKIKYALIDAAREHGTMILAGPRVGLGYRDLPERAGVALSTVQENLPEMKKAGEIRADNLGRRAEEAGAFVLPIPESANSVHSPTSSSPPSLTGITSVPDLRVLKKLRHGAPYVWRLGPRAGMATLALLRSGGTLSHEELASRLCISRPRDLRRKGGVLERMQSVGMVECSEIGVSLTRGWREALQKAREVGREEEAERLKELWHRVERARYAYRREESDETRKRYEHAVKEYYRMRHRLRQERVTAPVVALPFIESSNEVFTPTIRVHTDGERIMAAWEQSEFHPLACDCVTCQSPAPKYVKPKEGQWATMAETIVMEHAA